MDVSDATPAVKPFDIIAYLGVICTPSCWIQNERFSREWDTELTWLLDHGFRFYDATTYYALIGPYNVWIGNHPYASFTIDKWRPSRRTVLRAGRILREDSQRSSKLTFVALPRPIVVWPEDRIATASADSSARSAR